MPALPLSFADGRSWPGGSSTSCVAYMTNASVSHGTSVAFGEDASGARTRTGPAITQSRPSQGRGEDARSQPGRRTLRR